MRRRKLTTPNLGAAVPTAVFLALTSISIGCSSLQVDAEYDDTFDFAGVKTFAWLPATVPTKPVTLLDGDIVRKNLSSELRFSREHRDLNIRRIGFVASEINKNRGVAICAPIAPFRSTRRDVRELISGYGGFVEVHVATPLEVCEQRDRKGLYARARAGLISGFTGIDDPYEAPEKAELVIDTTHEAPEESAQRIVSFLEEEGYFDAE